MQEKQKKQQHQSKQTKEERTADALAKKRKCMQKYRAEQRAKEKQNRIFSKSFK